MSPAAARRVRLVNPNAGTVATGRMVAAAREAAPAWLAIDGYTTAASPSLIVDEAGAAAAEQAVVAAAGRDYGTEDGIILSAYIDPGIERIRALLGVPVVGIGEASMRAAAAVGRFAVVMTTPGLVGIVRRYAGHLGLADRLVAVPSTTDEPHALMADPERVVAALDRLIRQAVRDHGAEAVVVGGGPLADAARTLAPSSPVPLIQPVPAAVRRMAAILAGETPR